MTAHRRTRRAAAALLLAGLFAPPSLAAAPPEFEAFLAELGARARSAGVSDATVRAVLPTVAYVPSVVQRQNKQPEVVWSFAQYLEKLIPETRVEAARAAMSAHAPLLDRIEREYGVPRSYVVAFWSLESLLGKLQGDDDVPSALATLAFEGRRAEFFGEQFVAALELVDRGWIARGELVGSWAGAIGQVQFIPTTYLRHAVDFDRDGRRDLRGSVPDALASAASYLSALGWDGGQRWGWPVALPSGFPWEDSDLGVTKPVAEWARLGVRAADGGPLPSAEAEASVLAPMGHEGPAFLVLPNFRRILTWNASLHYALAVGLLADRLDGRPPLPPIAGGEPPLTRPETVELQILLGKLGHDVGEADGIVGARTRAALRAFQAAAGEVPDGYADRAALARVREAVERLGREAG